MKKYLIVVCVILVVAFTSGFLTSYFTTTKSNANNNNNNNNQEQCGHEAQIQILMYEIESKQDRIKELEQMVDFLYEGLIEMFNQFDIQFDWINDLLEQVLDYQDLIYQANTEIHELEKQIAKLQTQLDFLLNQSAANWNGVWGQYVYDDYNDEYVFDELVTIENGIFTINGLDDEAEISVRIMGNTIIIFLDYDDSYTSALVFTYCMFNDYFILSDWLVLFTEDDFEDFGDYNVKPFLETDYYFVSILGDYRELILIEREGLK